MTTIRCSVTGIQIPTTHCPECRGTGSVPTGHTNVWGPVHADCGECEGTGVTMAPGEDPRWAIYDAEYDLWTASRTR